MQASTELDHDCIHVDLISEFSMQIMFSVIKQLYLFLALALFFGFAHATPVARAKILENYREDFKESVNPIKYIFVNANGKNHTNDGPGKIYMLNIAAKESVHFIYSTEVDHLFKEHFDVMVDDDSLISTPEADYLVLTMSRPHEYNSESVRCAIGMGENRAYLISIANNRINVLNRKFLGCGDSYKIIQDGEHTGYEIKDYSKGWGQPQSVLYLLQNGKLVRKENGPYKEER